MDKNDLTNNSCEACHADAPLVTKEEIEELKPKILHNQNQAKLSSGFACRCARTWSFDFTKFFVKNGWN